MGTAGADATSYIDDLLFGEFIAPAIVLPIPTIPSIAVRAAQVAVPKPEKDRWLARTCTFALKTAEELGDPKQRHARRLVRIARSRNGLRAIGRHLCHVNAALAHLTHFAQ